MFSLTRRLILAATLLVVTLNGLAVVVFLRDSVSEKAVAECRGDLEAAGKYSEVGRYYCNCFASELTAELGVLGVLRVATGNPASVFRFDEGASTAADSICGQRFRY